MKVIGITGHRGSGKTSVGYLLGHILNGIKTGLTKEEIEVDYPSWCQDIKDNNNASYDCSLYYVYFDEFGEMPKSFVAQLLAIDMAILDNDTMKDKMYVNMKDFKLYAYDPSFKIITTDEMIEGCKNWKDAYISLREFTKGFSINIMQKIFGTDVWIKTRRANDDKWSDPEDGWKIFSDVKTKDEIKYIREKSGIIVRTLRPSHRKSDAGITNVESADAEFIINTEGPLYGLFDKIYEIAEKIYENNG